MVVKPRRNEPVYHRQFGIVASFRAYRVLRDQIVRRATHNDAVIALAAACNMRFQALLADLPMERYG